MTEFRRSFKRTITKTTTSSTDDGTTNQIVPILNCDTSGGINNTNSGIIGATQQQIGQKNNSNSSMMGSGRKTPLLKRINSQSNSGSSTTSTIIGGGGGGVSGSGNNREINYCEVYYLSPSKRKSKDNLYQTSSSSSTTLQRHNNEHIQSHNHQHQQTPQLQINPVQQHFQSSELNWSGGNDITNQKNISRYSVGDRIKSRTPENIFSYGINNSCSNSSGGGISGTRNAIGVISDQSLDNFDICSHYSDSAAVITKNSHFIKSNNGGGGQMIQSLLRSDSSGGGGGNAQRTNNVTFSNCTTGNIVEERIHRHGSIKNQQQQQQQQIHSNRGSLRRSKGRSNQSLCSCDAGETTDITLNPNRPLYQYSLDRKKKSHTYTCEQNAQILMRLEREKSYKINKYNKFGIIGKLLDKQGNDVNYNQNGLCDETTFDYPDLNNEIENDSMTDVDIIPPPPPPPNRKQQLSLKQDLMAPTASTIASSSLSTTANNNNNNNNNSNSCLKSSTSIGNLGNLGESMLNDCTSTILNCANVGQMVLTGGTSSPSTTTTAATTHTKQPDLCQMNRSNNSIPHKSNTGLSTVTLLHQQQQHENDYNNKNNIIINKNQHNLQLNQDNNIPLTPYPYIRDDSYIPCFKSKSTISTTTNNNSNNNNNESTVFFYHQESPQYAPNFDNHRPFNNHNNINNNNNSNRNNYNISGKYNTIGPSSCYAKQLANYHQQQQQQYHPSDSCNFTQNNDYNQFGNNNNSGNLINGRYFSQSLTNFAFTGSGNDCNLTDINHSHGNLHNYNNNHHFHHLHHDNNNSTMPYTQFRTQMNGGISCSFGDSTILNNSSSFTTIGSSNSGLKGKDHHHHQHHHQQQQQNQQSISNSRSTSSFMPWKHRQCLSRGSSSSGSNSLSFDLAKHWLAVSSILLIIGAASVAVPLALRVAASAPFEERLQIATQLLDSVPLIDGHNDLPWNIRKFLHNKLNDFNFDEDLRNVMPWARSHWSHTDLQRLKNGRVSAQFWAAYVPCEAQHRDAVQLTLEQIDVIKRLTERYSPQLTTCTSASDIIEAHKGHKLCSLTGVEGGHSLGGSLAVLRTLYAIGVRYMTLTSTCHTPWADSSYADAPTFNVKHGGLTPFGKTIIREMNRLGMIVDLSHVSTGTMRDSLATTEAPVIFSHSSAYELCNSSRNVQDDILLALAKNGGLVMVNFYSKFLSCTENSTVHDAVAHINHIRRVAGIDHVGLGAGFDGINFTPKGLEDVSSYPTLFAELLGEGWSIDELKKLAGENFLRVMTEVETIRDEKKKAGVRPYEDHPNFRTEDPYNCTSS